MQAFWPNRQTKEAQIVLYFIAFYITPIAVFVLCYTRMALVLYRGVIKVKVTNEPGKHSVGSNTNNVKSMSPQSRKSLINVVKTMIVVSAAFFVCYSPNQWLFLFYNFGYFNYHIFYHPIYNISIIAIYLHCCIDPLIYVATYHPFKEAIRRIIHMKVGPERGTSATAITSNTQQIHDKSRSEVNPN